MKAWILNDVNDFVYDENKDKPVCKDDEVLIKVMRVGICGSDIPRVYKDGAHNMPLIIGHEFAGEVAEVANESDTKLLGKKVGIFPLIPCKKCRCCEKKQYEMCRNYNYLGSRKDGGFAEYVAVPKWNIIELPDNITYEQAAMLEPMAVAVHSIRKMKIEENDSIVVLGLGTIGLFITMFLLEQGYKNIYVIGNKAFQKKKVLELGITEENFCDCNLVDIISWINQKTNGNGIDAVFECVGKNETFSQAIEMSAPGAKICLVGNPLNSEMTLEKNIYWKILRNQLSVVGTWNSSFTKEESDDWHYVLDKLANNRISPERFITHRFKIEEADKGFEIMRDKSEDYIKVICEVF